MTKNPNRQRRFLSVIGVSLLIATGAACGSDKKSETTDAPTEASSAVSAAETIASTDDPTDTTAASETTAEVSDTVNTVATVPPATAVDDREAILEYIGNLAVAAGAEFDRECVVGLIGQLSDEDAKLVADSARAGGEGDPELSPEGDAIGDQLESCVTFDPTATTG